MSELPVDHPEVGAVLEAALGVLVAESDRGAALVAAEMISDTLGKFLEEFFPKAFKPSRLLEYPAPLSTLAARTDAAYAFRLITANLYRAIGIIRKVRNDAAHSWSAFSLDSQADRLRTAYGEIASSWTGIDHLAKQLIVLKLAHSVRADERGVWKDMYDKGIFSGPEEVLLKMADHPGIDKHVSRFHLAAAVSLLCALIVHLKLKLFAALTEGDLLVDAVERASEQPEIPGEEGEKTA